MILFTALLWSCYPALGRLTQVLQDISAQLSLGYVYAPWWCSSFWAGKIRYALCQSENRTCDHQIFSRQLGKLITLIIIMKLWHDWINNECKKIIFHGHYNFNINKVTGMLSWMPCIAYWKVNFRVLKI